MALPRGLRGEAGHAPRALVLHAAAGVGGRGSQGQPLPAGQRLEVVDQAVVAAVQEKQHGAPDDARAARGALLEDVVVLQPVRPQGLLHTKTKTSTRPALRSSKASMSSKFTGRSVGTPEKSTPASARAGCQPGGRGPRRPASSGSKKEPEQLVAFDRCRQVSPSSPGSSFHQPPASLGGGGAGVSASCCEGAVSRYAADAHHGPVGLGEAGALERHLELRPDGRHHGSGAGRRRRGPHDPRRQPEEVVRELHPVLVLIVRSRARQQDLGQPNCQQVLEPVHQQPHGVDGEDLLPRKRAQVTAASAAPPEAPPGRR